MDANESEILFTMPTFASVRAPHSWSPALGAGWR